MMTSSNPGPDNCALLARGMFSMAPLLCAEVVCMLSAKGQMHIRCAGSAGLAGFEEAVIRGGVAIAVHVSDQEGDAHTESIPVECDTPLCRWMRLPPPPTTTRTAIHPPTKATTIIAASVDFVRLADMWNDLVWKDNFDDIDGYATKNTISVASITGWMRWESGRSLTRLVQNLDPQEVHLCGGTIAESTNLGTFRVPNGYAIPDAFLQGCRGSLRRLDLAVFEGVTKVGSKFLAGCSSIDHLDLHPLRRVSTIGSDFLSGCVALTHLDMLTMDAVEDIGSLFLSECRGLETVTLSKSVATSLNGAGILLNAERLQTFTFEPFANVTRLPQAFLGGCTRLQTLDLEPLGNARLSEVPPYFLNGCLRLQDIDLSGLEYVTVIRRDFLAGCLLLEAIDLSPLGGVVSVGQNFLLGCAALEEVDLLPMANVVEVDAFFLHRCGRLRRVRVAKACPLADALQTLPREVEVQRVTLNRRTGSD